MRLFLFYRAVAERLNRGASPSAAPGAANLSAAASASTAQQPTASSSSSCPPPAAPASTSGASGTRDLWGTAAVLNALGLSSSVVQIEVGHLMVLYICYFSPSQFTSSAL